jgi:hypothetical protein
LKAPVACVAINMAMFVDERLDSVRIEEIVNWVTGYRALCIDAGVVIVECLSYASTGDLGEP